jgi:hypothetical protein
VNEDLVGRLVFVAPSVVRRATLAAIVGER